MKSLAVVYITVEHIEVQVYHVDKDMRLYTRGQELGSHYKGSPSYIPVRSAGDKVLYLSTKQDQVVPR